jgi:ornithine carbamoyltransferase
VPLPPALSLDLRGRSLTRVRDWTAAELEAVLDLADELKEQRARREPHRPLEGRTVGLLFRKHSTRTRVSLEVAAAQLGATALYLPGEEQLQLARGESVEDTARVLSRYLDALAIRTHAHAEVEAFAAVAGIPVVNALTDEAHPLQALADLQTIRERFGALEGVRVAWVGDGSNVCVSLAEASALLGLDFVCAAPAGYEPPDPSIEVVRDPREAAASAHVLVTDVWVSMGQEAEREQRVRDLAAYALDADLLALADPDAIVLHCLPAHPGEEIAGDVLYGPRSAVWDEAENRLHTAKALLALTVGGVPAPATRR